MVFVCLLHTMHALTNMLTPLHPPHTPHTGTAELKAHLQARRSAPYWQRIADFHLLLYLARQPNWELGEIGALVEAVAGKQPVPEGFQIIIDSMAGL